MIENIDDKKSMDFNNLQNKKSALTVHFEEGHKVKEPRDQKLTQSVTNQLGPWLARSLAKPQLPGLFISPTLVGLLERLSENIHIKFLDTELLKPETYSFVFI